MDGAELQEKSLVCHRVVEIPPESSVDSKIIRDLNLPEDCVLVKIISNSEIILPSGHTLLLVGDIVEIFGMEEKLNEAEEHLIA